MTGKNIISVAVSLLLLVLAGMVSACSQQDGSKPTLTVTIAPQKYLLDKITGDKYDVVSMLSANADPETYDPTVTSMMGVQKSDLFFRVGTIGFEQAALGKIAETSPDLKIVNCAAGIKLSEGTHGGPRGYDPHIWVSVRNARQMARNMYDALVEQYPKDKKYFSERYAALDRELVQLDSTLTAMLAPCRGAAFVIKHPSLTYFARDYGLNQVTIEMQGKEASPAQMRERLDAAGKAAPVVFFIEKGHDSAAVVNLAESMNLPTVEISSLDYEWKDNLLAVARAVARQSADRAVAGK